MGDSGGIFIVTGFYDTVPFECGWDFERTRSTREAAMGLFGKKKPAGQESLGLKEKLAVWFIVKWIKDGLEGKKGKEVMESLKKINGLKSAILLALLLVEGGAKATGHDTGPLFGVLRGVLGSLGWSADAQTVDLASQGVVAVVGVYAIYGRVKAWYASHYGPPAK